MEFNIFEALPEELSEHVFLFFSPRELEHCATVCRFFEQITSSDELWKRYVYKDRREWEGSYTDDIGD